MGKNLKEFLAAYNPNGEHPVTEIETASTDSGHSPFITVRHGPYTMIINPLGFDDHLCLDVHSFVNGEDATAGAFGMSHGRQIQFPEDGPITSTSHGWPSAGLVTVLLGEQG